jgi:uncharacterized OB-fold protein
MEKPPPPTEGLAGDWYRLLAERGLHFQRCACGRWRHPPRAACPACRSEQWTWELAGGEGRIFSWTVTHQAMHPAWADDVPYAIVLGAMAEGVRLVAGWAGPLDDLALDVPILTTVRDGLPVFQAR